jgi:uncharacterized membrane protein
MTAAVPIADARFSAVLTPHRSLGPRGFLILMSFVTAISFAAGVAFALMGAWPVLGFFGLDVLAVWWAFRANYRAARVCETVDLGDEALVVRRYDKAGGVREWSFQSYWLRVEIEENEDMVGPLHLVSHGRRLAVGDFLSGAERRDFARALRQALAAA